MVSSAFAMTLTRHSSKCSLQEHGPLREVDDDWGLCCKVLKRTMEHFLFLIWKTN